MNGLRVRLVGTLPGGNEIEFWWANQGVVLEGYKLIDVATGTALATHRHAEYGHGWNWTLDTDLQDRLMPRRDKPLMMNNIFIQSIPEDKEPHEQDTPRSTSDDHRNPRWGRFRPRRLGNRRLGDR